jgi:ATP-dependent Clp protease protease subunit
MSGLELPGAPDASRDGDGSNRNATPDIFQQLLRQRIVFLGRAVDDELANHITAQLLFLEGQDPKRDIWLYINSPGGSITSGMAIYDTMQFVTPDVGTICMGLGASMAQFLLCAGAPGKRYALPHARILMHQPHGGVQGQASDIAIQAEQMTYIKKILAERISEHTGQPVDQIEADFDRDRWFTAKQAKEYGIVDEVIADRGAIR